MPLNFDNILNSESVTTQYSFMELLWFKAIMPHITILVVVILLFVLVSRTTSKILEKK